jgi:hypothetical protein
MGLFHRMTPEEKFIAKEMKLLEAREKRTLRFAEYAGILAQSKAAFERTIDVERLNALKRRKEGLSDITERSRIHDACVGLLAVQETEFELASARNASDFKQAEKNIKKLLGKLYYIASPDALSKKEYKANLGTDFEDGVEPVTFSERAEMIDEKFVEWIIQGYTMKECIQKSNHVNTGTSTVKGIDFRMSSDDEADINSIRADADQH